MRPSLESLRLYRHSLLHLKPWQVLGRIVAPLRGRITSLPHPPAGAHGHLNPKATFPHHDSWNDASDVRKGKLCFLNRTEELGNPIDWEAAHLPLLWRFNLHYFHYLHLLGRDEQRRLCRSWIEANPPKHPVAWHPYPTSLRIVNWCRAQLDDPEINKSLYVQAAFLYRNLETYVYGNHLLENARALVIAGCYFDAQGEAPRWLEKGLEIYRRETEEQILSDGGHFERSPMYHALMLEGYLDVLNVLPEDHRDRGWIRDTAARMSDVLVSLTHLDGELALFNDSTQEIAPEPERLLEYARTLTGHEPKYASVLPETGYFVHRDDDCCLIIDGGKVGPDYLMAHAHADVFSYELSLFGQQFVVDTGVYEYQAGPMRSHVRSTVAHNTVSIDGMDQVECWGSFRVARRSEPRNVMFSHEDHVTAFEGTFAGYAQLIGDELVHRRRIVLDARRRAMTVTDQIDGRGQHRVESRVHFHPDAKIDTGEGGAMIRRRGAVCHLSSEYPIYWEDGSYCPEFGKKLPNRVAVIGGDTTLPAELSYTISY